MEVVFFTGISGVGKSTLAQILAKEFNMPLMEERRLLHNISERLGFEKSRECLKVIGLEKYLHLARQETSDQLTSLRNYPRVFIDGAYDLNLPFYLKDTLPEMQITLVAILANRHLRRKRVIKRSLLFPIPAIHEARLFDSIKYHAGVNTLIRNADYFVRNGQTIETAIKEIILTLGLEILKS